MARHKLLYLVPLPSLLLKLSSLHRTFLPSKLLEKFLTESEEDFKVHDFEGPEVHPHQVGSVEQMQKSAGLEVRRDATTTCCCFW